MKKNILFCLIILLSYNAKAQYNTTLIHDFGINPTNQIVKISDREFCFMNGSGIYYTNDLGKTYKEIFKLFFTDIANNYRKLTATKSQSGIIRFYFYYKDNIILTSSDLGDSWTEIDMSEYIGSSDITYSNFYKDKSNKVYFSSGNLYRIDDETGEFIKQKYENDEEVKSVSLKVFHDNIARFVKNEKLYGYDSQNDYWYKIDTLPKLNFKVGNEIINTSFFTTFKNNFYLSDSKGIYFYNKESKSIDSIFEFAPNKIYNYSLNYLINDDDSLLIFKTLNFDTLVAIDLSNHEVKKISSKLFSSYISSIIKYGDLYIANTKSGAMFSEDGLEWQISKPNISSFYPVFFSKYIGDGEFLSIGNEDKAMIVTSENEIKIVATNKSLGGDRPLHDLKVTKSGLLLASVPNKGVIYSSDKGETWNDAVLDDTLFNCTFFVLSNDKYYSFSNKSKIIMSEDEGKSWKTIFVNDREVYHCITLDNEIIYNDANGFYKITGSNTSEKLNFPIFNRSFMLSHKNIIYLVQNNQNAKTMNISRTSDLGLTWDSIFIDQSLTTLDGRYSPTLPYQMTLDDYGNLYIATYTYMFVFNKNSSIIDTFRIDNGNELVTLVDYDYYNDTDKGVIIGTHKGKLYLMDNPSSVNEDKITKNINVFPNPSDDKVTIEYEYTLPASLEIYNLIGEKVFEEEITASNPTISVESLDNGVYFVNIKSEKEIKNQKIIVSKK